MNTNPKKILITSGRSPAGLEIARILNQCGHEVYSVDSLKYALCGFSNAIKKQYQVPPPRQSTQEYINEIIKIIKKNKIDLIIPSYEETFYISLNKEKLQKHCEVFVDDIKKLKKLHNKYEFIKYCESINLVTPRTKIVSTKSEAISAIKQNKETVLKPVYSRYGEEVVLKPSEEKINKLSISESNKWVIQDKLKGKQLSSYSVTKDGKLLAHCVYPIDITIDKVSINFKTENNTKIKKWVEQFIKKTNYTGQISFDFFETENKEIYAIECNPRITSGIHLFRNNENFVNAIVNQNNKNIVEPNKKSNSMIAFMVMIYGFTKIKNIKKNITTFFNSKDIIFSLKDPLPLIGQIISFSYIIIKSKKNKVTPSRYTTLDIEWNGEGV